MLSDSGWLSDVGVEAAQLLILQQFPHTAGLQAPTLRSSGFPSPQRKVCAYCSR